MGVAAGRAAAVWVKLQFLHRRSALCMCKLDGGRQEEHRDEGHGQELHCADTVSAHGQGDGASGACIRGTSFEVWCAQTKYHTVEVRAA